MRRRTPEPLRTYATKARLRDTAAARKKSVRTGSRLEKERAPINTGEMVNEAGKMTTAEAVRVLRSNPQHAALIRDSYLDEDTREAAERFRLSREFSEVLKLLGERLRGAVVLDLGAGTGIASYALARSGARVVYALEPESGEIGRDAIMRLKAALPIEVLDASGEQIPLPDSSVDIVYARQVLHHAGDLRVVLLECARILKSGGQLLVCREHVADDEEQLEKFLAAHPIHRLAGGEHAYPLDAYVRAIAAAGLMLKKIYDPWDTLINAFPTVSTNAELDSFPDTLLRARFGRAGAWLRFVPGVRPLVWRRIRRGRFPGRLYSFLAVKP